MSIQEIAPNIARVTETRSARIDTFERAAWQSASPYDSDEQRLARAARARDLAQRMQAGEPVLQFNSQLNIQAGTLLGEASVTPLPRQSEYGLWYQLWQGEAVDGIMPLKHLVPIEQFGAPQFLPHIAVGREEIGALVCERFAAQRALEAQPNGVPWNDVSPLTELYLFSALRHTAQRASDFITSEEAAAMRERFMAALNDPHSKHLQSAHIYALLGMDHISEEQLREAVRSHE